MARDVCCALNNLCSLLSLFDSFQFRVKSLVAERETVRNLEVINL